MESKYGKFIGTTLKIPENKFAKPNSFKWKTSKKVNKKFNKAMA